MSSQNKRRNNNRINNNFKFNNYFKFGMTSLVILIPIGYIYRKELKKCLNLTFESYCSNLEKNIINNQTDIIYKTPYERITYIKKIIIESNLIVDEIGSAYLFYEKVICKILPKTCKKLFKFLKK